MTLPVFYAGLFALSFARVYAARRLATPRRDFTSRKTVMFGDESAVRPDRAASTISVIAIFLM